MKIRVGIVGASGYSGTELLKLLVRHPNVDLTVITSESNSGRPLSELNPYFAGKFNLTFSALDCDKLKQNCDAVFFATPSGITMNHAHHFYDSPVKVIDISGDFRLLSNDDYLQWYKRPHNKPEDLNKWVYGLTEVFKEEISKAQFLANPGCYPTSILLGLIPFLKLHIPNHPVICDSKSGVSGKGKKASIDSLYIECNENFMAYKINGHQHIPEIEKTLKSYSNKEVSIVFTPHLVPMDRGILSTIYLDLSAISLTEKDIHGHYETFYQNSPFVKVLPLGQLPQTKHVSGTNECHLALAIDQRTKTLKIISVIDNLIKGAAGSALQNFNVMFNFNETTALS